MGYGTLTILKSRLGECAVTGAPLYRNEDGIWMPVPVAKPEPEELKELVVYEQIGMAIINDNRTEEVPDDCARDSCDSFEEDRPV